MSRNWCLFTAYDQAFAKLAKFSVPAMQEYANQHDMDFAEHADIKISKPISWIKIDLALEKFASGYEYLFWVDTDAIICRFDEDIRGVLRDDADIYFALENIGSNRNRLNAGVWVMRNSDTVIRFLKEIQKLDKYLHHKWWEQAAIIETLGLWSMFDSGVRRTDEPTPYMEKLSWLPGRWNTFAGIDLNTDAIIRHFIALNADGKEAAIRLNDLLNRLEPGVPRKLSANFWQSRRFFGELVSEKSTSPGTNPKSALPRSSPKSTSPRTSPRRSLSRDR